MYIFWSTDPDIQQLKPFNLPSFNMSGEDESTANVTLVGDSVNKLIRISGAHRGAYTKLERKADALAANPISTDLQLMDSEALLKTLKTKYLTIS